MESSPNQVLNQSANRYIVLILLNYVPNSDDLSLLAGAEQRMSARPDDSVERTGGGMKLIGSHRTFTTDDDLTGDILMIIIKIKINRDSLNLHINHDSDFISIFLITNIIQLMTVCENITIHNFHLDSL